MSEENQEKKKKPFHCGFCGKRLNHENADVAGYGYGRIPACSYKCQLALVKKYEKKQKEEKKPVPSYNRRYVKIDEETNAKIIEMRKKNYSAQVISRTVGHGVSSIYMICNRAGLPFSKR